MNEHPNMQANKLNAKSTKENAQHNPKVINSYKAKVHNKHSLNY